MPWVRVPATTANLGPGFDSFGLALSLANHFRFEVAPSDTLSLLPHSKVALSGLTQNPADNLVFRSADFFYQRIGQPRPSLAIEIDAAIPLARGLGSSSTAIVAGLALANAVSSANVPTETLVQWATELEGHPDNVTPAILGGAVLCDESGSYPLPWPDSWKILVVVPPYPLLTEAARRVLPASVPMADAIGNLRKASLLVYALLKEDGDAFRASLTDHLHQPYRGSLIPEFDQVRALADECGAFGAVISGAGPTLAVFYPQSAESRLLEGLAEFQKAEAPEHQLLRLAPDMSGVRIVETLNPTEAGVGTENL